MSELLTPEEANKRWPAEDYPSDTLGGMRRDLTVRAHALADELKAKTRDTAAEALAKQVAEKFLTEMADMEARMDELQEEGLREAFRHLMGYELPHV